ncbi:hypothetical protein EVAR_15076_1 [Eumeta japonica]|uniref:Uncharacterized protein n=1 Tax=Eumeta variegata TaxID=151549 RepID=A0A4C1YN61_EUMVA|nr:hypothetical protein EVAR_15076_1 [Eumeta japonica]
MSASARARASQKYRQGYRWTEEIEGFELEPSTPAARGGDVHDRRRRRAGRGSRTIAGHTPDESARRFVALRVNPAVCRSATPARRRGYRVKCFIRGAGSPIPPRLVYLGFIPRTEESHNPICRLPGARAGRPRRRP